MPCAGTREIVWGPASAGLAPSMPSFAKPARFPDTGVANGLPVRCPGPVRFRMMCLVPAG